MTISTVERDKRCPPSLSCDQWRGCALRVLRKYPQTFGPAHPRDLGARWPLLAGQLDTSINSRFDAETGYGRDCASVAL